MALVKCIVPRCSEVGDISGRVFACAKHAKWIVPTVRGAQAVARAAVTETVKQVRSEVKVPWWIRAFVDGVKDAS